LQSFSGHVGADLSAVTHLFDNQLYEVSDINGQSLKIEASALGKAASGRAPIYDKLNYTAGSYAEKKSMFDQDGK
jgi:hypothetical protein